MQGFGTELNTVTSLQNIVVCTVVKNTNDVVTSIRYTKVLFIRVAKLKYSKMLVLPINLGLIF